PNLFSDAYDKKIILCAPTTLMATLRTVERIWQLERQNRNAEEIARRGGLLYDKFYGFISSMKEIDESLGNARKSYDKARGQLATGSGNLIGQANKLHDLSVNTKNKRLEPKNIGLEEFASADEE
ncbi:MAG: DNA recombination protein RmuC, partial [Betaproteobacteria bacterium]|nr:DNA recombination protein RmuC [Betaproteobacteria bacterium]